MVDVIPINFELNVIQPCSPSLEEEEDALIIEDSLQ
jgi:hypothetical protein